MRPRRDTAASGGEGDGERERENGLPPVANEPRHPAWMTDKAPKSAALRSRPRAFFPRSVRVAWASPTSALYEHALAPRCRTGARAARRGADADRRNSRCDTSGCTKPPHGPRWVVPGTRESRGGGEDAKAALCGGHAGAVAFPVSCARLRIHVPPCAAFTLLHGCVQARWLDEARPSDLEHAHVRTCRGRLVRSPYGLHALALGVHVPATPRGQPDMPTPHEASDRGCTYVRLCRGICSLTRSVMPISISTNPMPSTAPPSASPCVSATPPSRSLTAPHGSTTMLRP